jgi:small subunit ribosomal protein S6
MSNKYDLTLVLRAGVKDEAKDKFVEKIEKTVKALEGKVIKVMEMGHKQLAYKLGGQSEGVYIDVVLEMPGAVVVQLEKKLTVDKEILRHLLVVID